MCVHMYMCSVAPVFMCVWQLCGHPSPHRLLKMLEMLLLLPEGELQPFGI